MFAGLVCRDFEVVNGIAVLHKMNILWEKERAGGCIGLLGWSRLWSGHVWTGLETAVSESPALRNLQTTNILFKKYKFGVVPGILQVVLALMLKMSLGFSQNTFLLCSTSAELYLLFCNCFLPKPQWIIHDKLRTGSCIIDARVLQESTKAWLIWSLHHSAELQ